MTDQVARSGPGPILPEALYLRALEVGRTAAGCSGPNPPVGCLIVRDGVVIAEGATERAGGRHAETVALAVAGDRAHGTTAIVTLEPCMHHGRTPPCTTALIAAGVAEVHVLHNDPDPVASGGLVALMEAGVRVVEVPRLRPDLAARAAHDLRGFLTRVAHGRPHVTLKLAQTVDGRTVPGPDRYLTGEHARRRVHELRAESDAVLVGGATVRTDDPMLDVRLVPASRQPRPVVLSAHGSIPPCARVVRDGAILVHGPTITVGVREGLEAAGTRLVSVPCVGDEAALDLPSTLEALLSERILTVLAEPGARLAEALLAAQVVDTVELHVAGGADAPHIRAALPVLAPLVERSGDLDASVTPDGDLILRSGSPLTERIWYALEGAA